MVQAPIVFERHGRDEISSEQVASFIQSWYHNGMSRNVVKFIVLCLVLAGGQMGLAAENASAANKTGSVKEDASVVRILHIGNSLTDAVNGWLAPVAESAGPKLDFHRFTIPGAPTDWLWKNPGS